MAKTKTNKSKRQVTKQTKTMTNGHASPRETLEELYAAALNLVEQSQLDEALSNARKLWKQVQDRGVSEALPALNLLGEISVELGDAAAAREYFSQAANLDPDGMLPESIGGGAEKFLWLAQLCDEGGQQSVAWFERGAKALRFEIATLENGEATDMNEETLLLSRIEKKRKLANALCGIVEVYMTDLSWENDAEARCENLITEALAVEDNTSPEVLQTLASVRLSQERKDDAQAALRRSLDTWTDLDPEDAGVPDFATRISLSRLLMEAGMEIEAMRVLNRLVQEDDQSVEAWYLGGWCQHLLAEREKAEPIKPQTQNNADSGRDEDIETAMKGSRHWLKTSIRLYELLDYEDERLFEHARELVAELDMVLGPEDEQAEAGEGYGDEWEGFEEDGEGVNEEMKDA